MWMGYLYIARSKSKCFANQKRRKNYSVRPPVYFLMIVIVLFLGLFLFFLYIISLLLLYQPISILVLYIILLSYHISYL